MAELTEHELAFRREVWGMMKAVVAPEPDVDSEHWRQFARYRDDPVGFVREVIGANPWEYSEAFLISLRDNRLTTVRASRGVAKTFTFAMATLWWMCTRNGVVLVFGAREDNIKNQVFAEIGLWHAASKVKLPGRVDHLHWRLGPRQFAQGIATKRPEGAQGFHAGRAVPDDPNTNLSKDELVKLYEDSRKKGSINAELLVLCDECVAIPDPIIQALKGSIQGPNARLALVANPLMDPDDGHEFARSHTITELGWHRMWVSSVECDDAMGFDAKFIAPNWLVDSEFIEGALKDWGPTDPRYLAYVLGCFPTSMLAQQFIPRYLLTGAKDLDLADDGRPESRHLGVDIGASNSGDPSVAVLTIGGVVAAEKEWKSPNLEDSAGLIYALMQEWSGTPGVMIPARNVHVDDCGVGKGISAILRTMGQFVDAVDVGAGPEGDWPGLLGEAEFVNRKAELWWIMRRALQEGRASIPEKYRNIWQQLQWHSYDIRPKASGSEIMHSIKKEDIKDRYGRSPDNADACVLAWSRSGGAPTVRKAKNMKGIGSLVGRLNAGRRIG